MNKIIENYRNEPYIQKYEIEKKYSKAFFCSDLWGCFSWPESSGTTTRRTTIHRTTTTTNTTTTPYLRGTIYNRS